MFPGALDLLVDGLSVKLGDGGRCQCHSSPSAGRYFTFPYQDMTLEQEMQLLEQPDKMCHFLAHNGWVMGDDPLRNFAEPGKYHILDSLIHVISFIIIIFNFLDMPNHKKDN